MTAPRRWTLALAAACLACGVPLHVIRLGSEGEPAPPQTGVRFRLARPVFHLELAMVEPGHRQLVLSQSMDGPPLVFQAETAASWLADTDVTLAVDANELLSSASAGEKDRTADVIEAALAVAGAVTQGAAPPLCDRLDALKRELADYETAQSERIRWAGEARKALDQCLATMLNCAARNAELERRQQAVQQGRLNLDGWSRLTLLANDPNHPDAPAQVLREHANPCFRVELKEAL